MCVHVFGSTSSPSCCNYALKQTAWDNDTKYLPDVAVTLKKNFQVDDLLKSLKDIDTAIKLVYDIIKMRGDGGFCFTKFVSKKVEVLEQAPEKDRRRSLQSMYLNSGVDFSTEKALGINGNIENGKLGFKVKLERTPKTRRGML